MTSKNLDILNICIIILAILVIFCLVYQNRSIEPFNNIMETKKTHTDFTPDYIHGDSVGAENNGLPLVFLVNINNTDPDKRNFVRNDLTYRTLDSYDEKLPAEDIENYVFGIKLYNNTNKISLKNIEGESIKGVSIEKETIEGESIKGVTTDLESIHLIPTRLNENETTKYFKIRTNDLLNFLELKIEPKKKVTFTKYQKLSEPWQHKFYFIPYYCTTDLKTKILKFERHSLLQKKNFCITEKQENNFREKKNNFKRKKKFK